MQRLLYQHMRLSSRSNGQSLPISAQPYGFQGAVWDGASLAQQVQTRPAPPAQGCHNSCVLLPWEAHGKMALIRLTTVCPAPPSLFWTY